MTKPEIRQEALALPLADQIELAQALWENASPPSDVELSPELKVVLEERLEEAREHPEDGLTWEEVKAKVLARS